MLTDLVNSYGYFGIGLLIFVENVFPPIPSEAVLLFGGFLTTNTDLNVWLVILAATVGSFVGTCTLYGIGRFFNRDRLDKIISGRLGRILRLKPEHLTKANEWFNKHGYPAVFFGRFVPIVRSLISIPAGMTKMPFPLFSLLSVIGSAIWNTVLVWAGRISGSAWESFNAYFGLYTKLFVVAAVIAASIWLIRRYYKKKGSASEKTDN